MDCIFCEIIKGNIPAKIIGENEHAIAFLDVNPVSDGHTIVIPKKHYKNFSECPQDILIEVIKLMHLVANKIKDSKLKPWGFNYLSNEEVIAGQQVMHFHMHIIPKYGKNEGFKVEVVNKYVDKIENVYKKLI